MLPEDVFDAFCHWWVSLYEGEVGAEGENEQESDGDAPSHAMERFFRGEAERQRLCGVMATHVELAHAQSTSCWEITVRKRRIRLNIGRLSTASSD